MDSKNVSGLAGIAQQPIVAQHQHAAELASQYHGATPTRVTGASELSGQHGDPSLEDQQGRNPCFHDEGEES
jgi:hypothetical protein